MAGHSKWENIKHKKERADAKKGKVFSRIAKEIITAVKLSGPDPKSNPRLRLALDKARAVNMPNDNIERNIKKASSTDQSAYEEMTYELYGHNGVGILAEIMTDNKNRIAGDMRIATNKRGGSIATPGAVSYNFERKGILRVSKEHAVEDELFMAVSDAGADDFEEEDDMFIVFCEPENITPIKEAIEALGFAPDETTIEMLPKTFVECDEESKAANMALLEWLEELDDVDATYHNMKL